MSSLNNTVTIYPISIVQMRCYIPWLPIFSSSGDRYCIMSGITPAETSINICRTENNILDNRVLRSVDYLLILQSTAANIFITRETGIVRCYGPFPFRRKLRSVTIARKIISLITNTCQYCILRLQILSSCAETGIARGITGNFSFESFISENWTGAITSSILVEYLLKCRVTRCDCKYFDHPGTGIVQNRGDNFGRYTTVVRSIC